MKKTMMLVLAAVALFVVLGCESTTVKGSGYKGKDPKMAKNNVQIVDYQGAAFGSEIPEWVVKVSNGEYSNAALSQVMPELKGRKVFVTIGSGDNLEFVKQWTDMVDIEQQVGDTMQRVVGKAVSASETGTSTQEGKTSDPTEVQRKLDMYKEAVSAVELNGLEKTASYWIEKVTGAKNNQKDTFEYYAVWTMDQTLFDKQIDAAMRNVKDNTSEGEALKKALKEKLTNLVASSNDTSLEAE